MQLASGTTIRVSIPAPKVTPVYSTRGEKGDAGTPGAPGGSDVAQAGWINDPASATRAALSATYAAQAQVKKARWDATVRGVVLDDFADLAKWGAGTGTPVLSQVTTEPGTPYAMRVVTGAGVEGQFARDFVVDLRNRSISFEFKAEDANFDQLRIDLPVDGRSSLRQFAKAKVLDNSTTATNAQNITQGVWKRVVVPASLFASDTGAPTSVQDVRMTRFRVTPKAGVSTSVLIRNLKMHEDPMPPGILWVFDDSRLNTYNTVRPIIEAKGWRGIIPTITNKLGGELSPTIPLMTLAQLQEMEAAGWEVVSHSHNHPTLAGASLVTLQSELRDSYNFLLANGFNKDSAKFFVYPGGSWDEQARKEAGRHYRATRSIIDHRQQSAYIGDPTLLETCYCDSAKTSAQVKAAMDQIVNRGGICILSFHEVIPDTDPVTSTSWTLTKFNEVVEYAASLGLPSYKFRDVYPYDMPQTGTP